MTVKNQCVLDGRVRCISDPVEVKDKTGKRVTLCRYQLEVPRPKGAVSDRIFCVAFGSRAWYAAKNIQAGSWISVIGHLHTEPYRNGKATLAVHYQKIIRKG